MQQINKFDFYFIDDFIKICLSTIYQNLDRMENIDFLESNRGMYALSVLAWHSNKPCVGRLLQPVEFGVNGMKNKEFLLN